MLPEFAVSRITPDHVHRVGLEKVLQGEVALGESEIFRRLGGDIKKGSRAAPVT